MFWKCKRKRDMGSYNQTHNQEQQVQSYKNMVISPHKLFKIANFARTISNDNNYR